MQSSASEEKCTKWIYDTSEFIDTAVTDNDWVCDKVRLAPSVRCQFLQVENVFLQANYVPDLYTLAVVGLILGTFIFSAIADFFGRKLSFYVGSATVIVFTLCMVPTDFNFHLFAFFKVRTHIST